MTTNVNASNGSTPSKWYKPDWLQPPDRKVNVAGLAGAVSVVLVWVLNTYVVPEKPIPAEIALGITTILSFLLGYFVPEAPEKEA